MCKLIEFIPAGEKPKRKDKVEFIPFIELKEEDKIEAKTKSKQKNLWKE